MNFLFKVVSAYNIFKLSNGYWKKASSRIKKFIYILYACAPIPIYYII